MVDPVTTEGDGRIVDEKLADDFLADANRRIQFQHEYTLAGFRTLILLEGGAIVALLTYAGNAAAKVKAADFGPAFGLYVVSLVLAVLGYLFAYGNQGAVSSGSVMEAHRLYGKKTDTTVTIEQWERRALIFFVLALSSVLLSLAGFVAASWFAMTAIF